jgi:acetylornithine/succinyldiaminopimelate/putrescine aminotransferase
VVGPVRAVRGRGLLLGLETVVPAGEVASYLRSEGILAGTSADPVVVRVMPPLTIGVAEIERLAEALARYPGLEPVAQAREIDP